jgi:AraC-like DNA-binding protein
VQKPLQRPASNHPVQCDINLKTSFLIPPSTISQFVSGILVIEDANLSHEFVIPLFANGSPTLVFQTAKAQKGNQTIGNLTLYGQTIQPAELKFRDGFTFIAYFLFPHALTQLFAIAPKEITDNYLDLTLLKQTKKFELQEQLLNSASLEESLQLIERFILNLSKQSFNDDRRILFAVNELKNSKGLLSLVELRNDLHITERSFQRLFENNIGISPNLYKRICQFQFAFQQVNQNRFLKLTDVAYDSGFADQSHFIRVFKEFTGLTPNEYLAKLAPYNPQF